MGGTGRRARPGLISRAFRGFFSLVNRVVPWHRLPPFLGVPNLIAVRNVLREKNLFDTETAAPSTDAGDARWRRARSSDGRGNDPSNPGMGAVGRRFGRNVPPDHTVPEGLPGLLEPNPRTISRRLLVRDTFVPAESLNLLAAAWIQFQVHDWFAHGKTEPGNEFRLPLEAGDTWPPGDPMLVRRTPPDPDRSPEDAGRPPTFRNRASHWWDGSQIYGSDDETTASLCSLDDGRLLIGETDHLLAIDPLTGFDRSGFTDNWWVGLSLLHTLFTREHNSIVDRLRRERPDWTGEQLFNTARLVNVALMAKIHTVEWTPGILAHPTLLWGSNVNWWGLAGERLNQILSRVSRNEVIRGIPGSPTDHHGVPFSLTEEFAAVYRLHPLLPESIRFASATDGRFQKELAFPDVAFKQARAVLDGTTTMADVAYSLGIAHPGAVVLHNFPSFLCNLKLPDGELLDLGAIDVLRDRERGIPRYNQFRRLVHCRPAKTFAKLTSNPQWAAELEDVYGDVERVDLLVGTLAEDRPRGFGFSDTAFRIFLLMASRRLNSDRFFTTDYTAEVYTQAGLDWVNSNTMKTVLLRHYPELAPALGDANNAFAPWKRIG